MESTVILGTGTDWILQQMQPKPNVTVKKDVFGFTQLAQKLRRNNKKRK